MRPLVVVRRATAFDPGFIGRDALLAPLEAAYRRLGPCDDFPDRRSLDRVFDGPPPVRFVRAEPRRKRGASVDVATLYDARIALEGAVPTRPGCWHDFMNALVWGTFPEAKRSLHRRQHRAIVERIAPSASTLERRTPELDALALIDEGGVIVLARDVDDASGRLASRRPGALADLLRADQAQVLVFGHAIYESLALGVRPAVVAAIVAGRDGDPAEPIGRADRALAAALDDADRLLTPRELVRVDLG